VWRPKIVLIHSFWFSQRTAFVFVNINWLIFVTEIRYFLWEVGTELLKFVSGNFCVVSLSFCFEQQNWKSCFETLSENEGRVVFFTSVSKFSFHWHRKSVDQTFWQTASRSAGSIPHFMEPEGLLSCSQEPATGSCPEPHKSCPHPRTYFLKIPFNIILQPVLWSSLEHPSTASFHF
jgi:hypothetical protein